MNCFVRLELTDSIKVFLIKRSQQTKTNPEVTSVNSEAASANPEAAFANPEAAFANPEVAFANSASNLKKWR
ncbi:hypothetical protein [uncultured Nostoc sp.]|uniref:hypothetical protein n=1 Tax=uncultured Nostoc sp. TaxID=340711 RepID=UPI0026030E01|nr:hypothetical protein [uncultured Nostoc sp.]